MGLTIPGHHLTIAETAMSPCAANHAPALAALDTAGRLRRLGCQVLDCHAINGRPWLRATLPARLDPSTRMHILAAAWQAPVTVEWGAR